MNNEKNILLVDDEKILLKITTRILENAGFNVFGFDSAEKAIETLNEENIDLIITDQNMPGIKGIDLILKIQENQPKTPAIILSGLIDNSITAEVKLSAPIKLCQKPLKKADLLSEIEKLLAN